VNRGELAALSRIKWLVLGRSGLIAGVGALAVAPVSAYASLAIGVGVACGIANMLAIMRGRERLLETGNPAFFGLSSLLRLAAFSIVAAALAVRGPWWSLGPFLAGFFIPLGTYALCAWRVFRR
jgi:hypothetical protein